MKNLILFLFLIASLNIFSNNSLKYLNDILKYNDNETAKSFNRLSSGEKLFKDDPANYAIYEKLEAQIREIDKTTSNNSDMISYYTYMEGVLSQIINILQDIRELLIQREGIILADDDKEIINNQIKQYYRQIDYEITQAEFNKVKIFKELLNKEEFKNYFDLLKFYDFKNVDNLLKFCIYEISFIGAVSNRLEYQNKGNSIKKENSLDFKSRGDTNYSTEINNLKKHSLLFMANILLL